MKQEDIIQENDSLLQDQELVASNVNEYKENNVT